MGGRTLLLALDFIGEKGIGGLSFQRMQIMALSLLHARLSFERHTVPHWLGQANLQRALMGWALRLA